MSEETAPEVTAVSVLDPALQHLSKSKAEMIEAVFGPMVARLKEFEAEHEAIMRDSADGITDEVVKRAHGLRMGMKKVRTDTEKVRKAEKEEYLRGGKAIDGVANILKFAVVDKEKELEAIEKHAENAERERIQKLQDDRLAQLEPYTENEMVHPDLGTMAESVWNHYYNGVKNAYEQKIAAEKKAEADRIAAEKARAVEEERIKAENEALKAQKIEDDRLAKIEQEKRDVIEASRVAKEKQEQAERDLIEANRVAKEKEDHDKRIAKERAAEEARIKAENERMHREQLANEKRDADLKKEREAAQSKQDAIEAELEKERAAKKKIEDDRLAAEQAEASEAAALANAGDKEQLEHFLEDVRGLWAKVPKLDNSKRTKEIQAAIDAVAQLCK